MTQDPRRNVLLIGIDSAEPALLLDWAQRGVLPHIKRLLERGTWCEATAPRGFGNGVVWPSLHTGVGPGTHGRYYLRQLQPGSYDIVEFQEDTGLCRAPFWKPISNAGKRVAVIDMVRAPLVEGLNGVQIADWLTHDATGHARSWPPALMNEIVARLGADPLQGNADTFAGSGHKLLQLRDALCQRIATKTQLTREYLQQGTYDLLVSVYAEPHDIGHLCWHLHDPQHVDHDPGFAKRHGDPLQDVYIALDNAIGELLAELDEHTTVLLFSGPGMGPDYTGNFVLDAILRRLEGLETTRPPGVREAFKSLYNKLLPFHVRRNLQKQRTQHRAAADASARSQRRFFQLPHNQNAGAIRINLEGREPNGRVSRRDYDAVCDELIRELQQVVNIDTGEPIVEEVVKVHATCHGPALERLPDLLAIWNRPAPIVTVASPRIGRISKPYSVIRTGDHTPHCIVMLSGPGITTNQPVSAIAVEAIAPTVAQILGVTLPAGDAPSRLASFQMQSHAQPARVVSQVPLVDQLPV